MIPILHALEYTLCLLVLSTTYQQMIKWIANIGMSISAIIISFSTELTSLPIVFVGFLVGHILWALSALSTRDNALIALNIGFIPIDLYAMYIRL